MCHWTSQFDHQSSKACRRKRKHSPWRASRKTFLLIVKPFDNNKIYQYDRASYAGLRASSSLAIMLISHLSWKFRLKVILPDLYYILIGNRDFLGWWVPRDAPPGTHTFYQIGFSRTNFERLPGPLPPGTSFHPCLWRRGCSLRRSGCRFCRVFFVTPIGPARSL